MAAPLDGVRVLDLTAGMPGAIATMLLADYGADVIHVRQPAGADWLDTRTWDRGKRRVRLDLETDADRARFLDLAGTSDVVIVGLNHEDRDRLGVGPREIQAVNPDVVYAALTGYGLDDDRPVPAHEVLAAAELGTMLAVPAIHRDGPVFPGHPAIAYSTAFVAVIGILAAVRARVMSGRGDIVDVSLRDGVLGQFTMNWWAERKVGSMSSRSADGELDLGTIRMIVRRYRCGDGRRIGVHTGADGAFTRLMKLVGLDERVSPVTGPVESATPLTPEDLEILQELHEIFASRPSAEWLEEIWANEVAALPVLAPGEVFDDPQVLHNEVVRIIEDPDHGPITVVASPIRMDKSPAVRTEPLEPSDTGIDWLGQGLGPGGNENLDRGPLSGVKIVEMSTFFAAPYANRFLRDLGATVVKIESVHGDPMRSLPDPFTNVSKGKRSLAIDLKAAEARPAIEALLSDADIVQHNFRPGAAERLRVDYDTVRELNPKVIYDYAPGYGSSGPKSMLQSFAPLHSGFVGLHTEAAGEGNDAVSCFGNEDYYNGQLNAIGQLLALIHRDRTGEGQYLECPQLSSAVFVTSHWYKVGDAIRSVLPTLDHGQYGWGPHQRLYQCLEGWLCVFCTTADERAAFEDVVLGTVGDPGDAVGSGTAADEQLAERLGYELFSRSAADWVVALRDADVPCTVARETSWLHEFLSDDRNVERGWATRAQHPDAGLVSVIGGFVRLAGAPQVGSTWAPELGEHSADVLAETGVDPETVDQLLLTGAVVGARPGAGGAR